MSIVSTLSAAPQGDGDNTVCMTRCYSGPLPPLCNLTTKSNLRNSFLETQENLRNEQVFYSSPAGGGETSKYYRVESKVQTPPCWNIEGPNDTESGHYDQYKGTPTHSCDTLLHHERQLHSSITATAKKKKKLILWQSLPLCPSPSLLARAMREDGKEGRGEGGRQYMQPQRKQRTPSTSNRFFLL